MIKNFLLFCLSFRIQVMLAQEAASQSDSKPVAVANSVAVSSFSNEKFLKIICFAFVFSVIIFTILVLVAIYVMLSINAKVGAFNQDMNAIAKAAEIFSQDVTELKNDMKVTKDVVVAEIQNLDNAMLDLGQRLLDLSEKLSAKVDENLVELKNALKAVALDIKLTKDVAVDEVKKLDDATLDFLERLLKNVEEVVGKIDLTCENVNQIDVAEINLGLKTASLALKNVYRATNGVSIGSPIGNFSIEPKVANYQSEMLQMMCCFEMVKSRLITRLQMREQRVLQLKEGKIKCGGSSGNCGCG